jgi:hypothetical protein
MVYSGPSSFSFFGTLLGMLPFFKTVRDAAYLVQLMPVINSMVKMMPYFSRMGGNGHELVSPALALCDVNIDL